MRDPWAESFVASARAVHNRFQDLDDTRRWLSALQERPGYKVERVALDEIEHWHFEPGSGDLRHASGRFFSVAGLDCRPPEGDGEPWQQPIILQPEVGILGIITKVFDGVRYFLMQAKMEPGNVNKVQISPTVQATFSNYSQVHRGRLPPYLKYFLDAKAPIISSQLQSETGTRFFRKVNRNILLDISEDIEVQPGFRWLTLHELQALLRVDNAVNMDARSVLSNIAFGTATGMEGHGASAFFRSACADSAAAHRSEAELREWLAAMRRRHSMQTIVLPLSGVRDWVLDKWEIRHRSRNYFKVSGVRVQAGDREVTRWSQPLLLHEGLGLAGFLFTEIGGVLHVLMQAKPEPGIVGGVALGPTVSVFDYREREGALGKVPLLEHFLEPRDSEVLHMSIQSEEGGRFWNLLNHFVVLRLSGPDVIAPMERYQWMTLAQLQRLSQGECLVNSEARTLLCCLPYFQTGQ